MVGSQQLAAVSLRLQQVIDLEPAFGGCWVIFSGDFAQLPPIGQKSLLFDGPPNKCERGPEASRLGHAGRRIFRDPDVSACVRLRVVYRQGEPCPFKESTMRLRGGAMTYADHDLWKSRDVLDKRCDPELVSRSRNFLWLTAENADCGKRNGEKLGEHATSTGGPISDMNRYIAKKQQWGKSRKSSPVSEPLRISLSARQ